MKKLLNALILLLICNSYIISQINTKALISDLKNYDINYYKIIIKDSIWLKYRIYKQCGFTLSKDTAEKVDILVIPNCKFKSNADNYKPGETVLDYLELNMDFCSGFILYNNKVIAYIVGMYVETNLLPKYSYDSLPRMNGFINPKLCFQLNYYFKEWQPTFNMVFKDDTTDYNRILKTYNLLDSIRPNYFFTIPNQYVGFWFVEKDNLKAYSEYESKIYFESELLRGISNEEDINGRYSYHFIYRNIDLH
jgi:hypothetical protein